LKRSSGEEKRKIEKEKKREEGGMGEDLHCSRERSKLFNILFFPSHLSLFYVQESR